MDWKDALSAMRGELPEGESPAEREQAPKVAKPAKKEKLTVSYERKGRGGKEATIISGFAETTSDEEIEALASQLKKSLGRGGSARGGEILLQGDVRAKLPELLKDRGYRV